MKINHELKANKNKVIGEFGYGIMWLFLSLLIEFLLYFDGLEENFYHFLAIILFTIALYKFVIAARKFKKFTIEKDISK